MMYQNFKCLFLWIAAISLLVGSCSEEPTDPIYEVHPDFEYLVNSFIEEGARQGVELTISNLRLVYSTDLQTDICAICNSLESLDLQKIIFVNREFNCWENSHELEALIFHELGHCILRRQHENATLPNGDPKSMMVEGNILVYAPCRYVFGPDATECNNLHKRDYYIQELFNPATPVPEWAK